MLVLPFRTPAVIIGARRRGPIGLDQTANLSMRVKMLDLDVYWHMNNGRYLTNMDLGRWDFTVRSGLLRHFLKMKMRPVMGGATIRYRRPLDAFQRYKLQTRVAGVDGRWFYFEQTFVNASGDLSARAIAKVCVRSPRGMVPALDLYRQLGAAPPDRPLPSDIAAWQGSDLG